MLKMTFMHTSSKDGLETVYHNKFYDVLDFTDIYGIHTMCKEESFKKMSHMVDYDDGQVFFLGNGNYHYMTLVLTELIEEPYTIIVFDNHNDASIFPFKGVTSCGSWINDALNTQQNLKKVYIIGVSNETEEDLKYNQSERLSVLSYNDLNKDVMLNLIHSIPTQDIYISVDRDVLEKDIVKTNWDQGAMQTKQLIKTILILRQNHHLLMADICGDVVWDYKTVSKDSQGSMSSKSLENLDILDKSLSLNV